MGGDESKKEDLQDNSRPCSCVWFENGSTDNRQKTELEVVELRMLGPE